MIFPNKSEGNRAQVEIITLECGNRQVPVVDRYGNVKQDANGNPILKTERSEPQNYTIRILPHAIKEGTDFDYVQAIRKHKDEDGIFHYCEGEDSCRFCKEGISAFYEYYSVIGLLNTDGKYSAGIYVLKYNFKFEQVFREFEDRIWREKGINTTSLGEDGCYISVYVFKNDSGYTDYIINLSDVGALDSSIKNDADIMDFVNSKKIPDLEAYVNRMLNKNRRKAYNFMEISNSFADYSENEPDLIRVFNEKGETVEEMICAVDPVKEEASPSIEEPNGDYEALLDMLKD